VRVTVCELPHQAGALEAAWVALCEHTRAQESELVLLPEFAMLEPVWEVPAFDAARWRALELEGDRALRKLADLCVDHVIGTRPVQVQGRRLNQAFLRSAGGEVLPLRSKYFLPEEPGSWEATWFHPGDPLFPSYQAGPTSLGINICTELWALETYAAYADAGVQLLLSPRATATATMHRWLAVGIVAAARSGAYCLSSNRVDLLGGCGGGGWIIDPAGEVLALTSAAAPFATRDIDLTMSATAGSGYPRYVFSASRVGAEALPAVPGEA